MNKILKVLMMSDLVLATGFGLIQPILSIFIADRVSDGSIVGAGMATTIFLIVKSAVQLPFSRYIDGHDHRKRWLILGTGLLVVVPLIYIIADRMWVIYVAQILYGIGAGLSFPAWLELWSTHLDKHHESFEWSLYSTLVSIGTAAAASIGALMVEHAGYTPTFLLVAVFTLISTGVLFSLDSFNDPKKKVPVTMKQYQTKKKNMSHH